ncbi:MAG: hypothetical protein DMG79_13430 [Acidobacteria bacterium]|nr:MAG: hypothetical protein DMG79_13430 [Acidobacteriota bacterium]
MITAFKIVAVILLLAVFSISASAQSGWNLGSIGPSKAEVAGAVVGLAAITGVILYLTLHKPSITGCIRFVDGENTLVNENDKLDYFLVDAKFPLKRGERVKLIGKKKKDREGNLTFQVKKMKKDYGPCQP